MWDHFSMLKYDLPSWQNKGFQKNIYILDNFSTLKYDPTPSLARKKYLSLGSFFNIGIWNPRLGREKYLSLGSFFNV
jgi:hypothetical protein